MSKFLLLLVTTLFSINIVAINQAQDISTPRLGYYLAPDANGVQQIFQLILDGQSEPRQITSRTDDVLNFAVANDGLAVAYYSAGQLWLQSVHTDEAIALTTTTASSFPDRPVFSQGDVYLSYADNGVWLLDLATRQTTRILEDVPLSPDTSNALEYRIYAPGQFVAGEDGTVTKLIVDIGVWEWNSEGVYDLATGQLQELEGNRHTSILPLSDGRALIYGNSGVAGEGSLHIADSLDNINNASAVVYFAELTEAVLFAERVQEIEADIVRVFGSSIPFLPNNTDATYFYFDFNTANMSTGDVQIIPLATADESSNTITGALSADGQYVPVYLNTIFTDAGVPYGKVVLRSLIGDDNLDIALPEIIGNFLWHD